MHHLHPRPPRITSLAALMLALLAVLIGLYPHPVLDLLGSGVLVNGGVRLESGVPGAGP